MAAPDWIRRLFNPDDYYGTGFDALSPAQRRQAELATQLDALDPWDIPSVVAARDLVASTAAVMPMVDADTAGNLIPTPPILRRPDPAEPYRRTIERIVNGMTRHGRAWLQVDVYGSNGHPLAAHVVDDPRVNATTDSNLRIVDVQIDGLPVDRSSIVHIPMTVTDRHPLGRSPLQAVDVALAQLAEVYRFSAGYYSTAAIPPYSVVHPTRLSPGQATEFADQWMLARAERRPAVLSGGVSIETYGATTAGDAALLDTLGYLDQVVARVMQLPPSLLNVASASSLTYSTTQGEFARWLAIGLGPMFLSRIEAAFTDMLPRGQVSVMDTSNLTRTDLVGRVGAAEPGAAILDPAPPMELPT